MCHTVRWKKAGFHPVLMALCVFCVRNAFMWLRIHSWVWVHMWKRWTAECMHELWVQKHEASHRNSTSLSDADLFLLVEAGVGTSILHSPGIRYCHDNRSTAVQVSCPLLFSQRSTAWVVTSTSGSQAPLHIPAQITSIGRCKEVI